MIDLSALECLHLEVILPDTGETANVIGRFTKNPVEDGTVPAPYKIHVIRHKEGLPYVPCIRRDYRHDNDNDPDKIDRFFGYFITRYPVDESSLRITDWSFFVA